MYLNLLPETDSLTRATCWAWTSNSSLYCFPSGHELWSPWISPGAVGRPEYGPHRARGSSGCGHAGAAAAAAAAAGQLSDVGGEVRGSKWPPLQQGNGGRIGTTDPKERTKI